jgi:hypothetical protein
MSGHYPVPPEVPLMPSQPNQTDPALPGQPVPADLSLDKSSNPGYPQNPPYAGQSSSETHPGISSVVSDPGQPPNHAYLGPPFNEAFPSSRTSDQMNPGQFPNGLRPDSHQSSSPSSASFHTAMANSQQISSEPVNQAHLVDTSDNRLNPVQVPAKSQPDEHSSRSTSQESSASEEEQLVREPSQQSVQSPQNAYYSPYPLDAPKSFKKGEFLFFLLKSFLTKKTIFSILIF